MEVVHFQLLPVRRDFTGGSHQRLFDDYVSVKRRLAVDVRERRHRRARAGNCKAAAAAGGRSEG